MPLGLIEGTDVGGLLKLPLGASLGDKEGTFVGLIVGTPVG